MKTKMLAMMLLAGGSMFAQTRLSIGLGFGSQGAGFYQTSPAYASNIPPCPGPGYTWVDGYWNNDYGRETWVAGYWSAPLVFTYQSAPRFDRRFVDRDDNRFVDRDDNRFVDRDDRRFGDRYDNRFGDRDDRQSFTHAPQQDRGRNFDQGRNFNGQGRNQNYGTSNRFYRQDNRQSNGFGNGFRGR